MSTSDPRETLVRKSSLMACQANGQRRLRTIQPLCPAVRSQSSSHPRPAVIAVYNKSVSFAVVQSYKPCRTFQTTRPIHTHPITLRNTLLCPRLSACFRFLRTQGSQTHRFLQEHPPCYRHKEYDRHPCNLEQVPPEPTE